MAIATIKIFEYISESDASLLLTGANHEGKRKLRKRIIKVEFSICRKSVLKQGLVYKLQDNL